MKDRQTISIQQVTFDKLKLIQTSMGEHYGFVPSVTQVVDMLVKFYNDTNTVKGESNE